MKNKESRTSVSGVLIVTFLLIFGCGLGYVGSKFFVAEYNPPWTMHKLPEPPEKIVDITYIDVNENFDDIEKFYDPADDVVYVVSESSTVYSNTLFHTSWEVVDPVPTWDYEPTKCATEWVKEDIPPLEDSVIESAGVRIERPTNLKLRCFVLLADGNIQFWEYHIDSVGFMGESMIRAFYMLTGSIIGIIIGFIALRIRKSQNSMQGLAS